MSMISQISKYFCKTPESDTPEEKPAEEPKTSNIENIKTTNFLRKLRKIDSTENILNLVQITEYKKTPKKESRRRSKKSITLNTNTDISEYQYDDNDTVKEDNIDNIVMNIKPRTSQQSMAYFAKITRKEKGENISFLSKRSEESSYESVSSEQNFERRPSLIGQLVLNESLSETTDFISQISHVERQQPDGNETPMDDKNYCLNNGQLEEQEVSSIQSRISEIELNSSKSFGNISFNQTSSRSKTNLDMTKSNIKLYNPSLSKCFLETLTDKPNTNTEDHKIKNNDSHSCINKVSTIDLSQKKSSRILLENKQSKDLTAKESASKHSIPRLGNSYSQELISHSLLSVKASAEKFIKEVNLQGSDQETQDQTDDHEETSVLFTRKSCSNDSFNSKPNTYENSKIPVLQKVDHNHSVPIKVMEPFNNQIQETPTPEQEIVIQPVIEQNPKNKMDNDRRDKSVINKTKALVPELAKVDVRTELHIRESLKKIADSRKRPTELSRFSTRNIHTRNGFQKQTRACNIKSKLSIFNSGINEIRNQKSSFAVNPKRTFIKTKETTSRAPFNAGTNYPKYKGFVPTVVPSKPQNYVQQNKNLSQKSRNTLQTAVCKVDDHFDSYKTIPMKSVTPKKTQLEKSKTSIARKPSAPKGKVNTETVKEVENEGSDLKKKVIKCKALKKEIMEKINEYEQSMQKVYDIKKELISKSDKTSIKGLLDDCSVNDNTVSMLSKINAVDIKQMKLKEQFLTDSDCYVKNAADKVKEELNKYHKYVEDKMNKLYAYQKNHAGSFTQIKDLEVFMKDTTKELELKSEDITESIFSALTDMTAEKQSLNQYCKELVKTNDECNNKLMEKLLWLEKENENLSTQIFTLKNNSGSSKTNTNDFLEAKKKDHQASEILKMYNDIEMKNRYHAQLVENFMKSVEMIENKIENHSQLVDSKVEKTTSKMEIAEIKRQALEETIEQLKKRLEENRREYQDLMTKMNEFQQTIVKLKAKNKALTKELLRYKYPVHLEKNIQKMIALRHMLVDIVHNNECPLPFQDNQLLDIMKSIDSDLFFPMVNSQTSYTDGLGQVTDSKKDSVELSVNAALPPSNHQHPEIMESLSATFIFRLEVCHQLEPVLLITMFLIEIHQ
ncbi:hypothetical protein WDU94_004011 [Cyamophila willieti]